MTCFLVSFYTYLIVLHEHPGWDGATTKTPSSRRWLDVSAGWFYKICGPRDITHQLIYVKPHALRVACTKLDPHRPARLHTQTPRAWQQVYHALMQVQSTDSDGHHQARATFPSALTLIFAIQSYLHTLESVLAKTGVQLILLPRFAARQCTQIESIPDGKMTCFLHTLS